MRRSLLLLAAALLMGGDVAADSEPPVHVDGWLAAQVALAAADWHQTRDFTAYRPDLTEANPILGPRPDAGRINRYFVITELATIAAAESFPSWRTTILGLSASVHAICVGRNAQLGVRVRF